jgi:phenylpyruvate tautomerase PptA (4-oxalocrotonate tautomerase family)
VSIPRLRSSANRIDEQSPRNVLNVASLPPPCAVDRGVAGDSDRVRVQVLTPVGVLDRDKQIGVVRELTDIVASAAGAPTLTDRTWVLITESPEGGWGINGHANTGADIAAAARAGFTGGG